MLALAVAFEIDQADVLAEVVGGSLDHGLQVEEAVGDMHREHAVRLQMPEILFEGLAGQQVDRDRVAGEGIDDEHIELLVSGSTSSCRRASPRMVSVVAGVCAR